jgi:hypothetical protein
MCDLQLEDHIGFGKRPRRRLRDGSQREKRIFGRGELRLVILVLVAQKNGTATRSSRSSATASAATIAQAPASSIQR